MAKLIYSAITSLDGYIADEDGNFDWAAPDEEVHAFVNDLERRVDTYLYGRRMYDVMRFWETAPTGSDQPSVVTDYARIWQAADKFVYSKTLAAASTALQYWNQRERTKQTFCGEWLRTGDRYFRDSDGYFWYQGRTDDVFKVSGQWVSPLEIESCLLSHPAVLECAVVGTPDEAGLVKPRAFVVRRAGTPVSDAELQALVKARLQPYKYPRWVEFVDELPKTASGKVQRFALRHES